VDGVDAVVKLIRDNNEAWKRVNVSPAKDRKAWKRRMREYQAKARAKFRRYMDKHFPEWEVGRGFSAKNGNISLRVYVSRPSVPVSRWRSHVTWKKCSFSGTITNVANAAMLLQHL
jgi:hypothetical protein